MSIAFQPPVLSMTGFCPGAASKVIGAGVDNADCRTALERLLLVASRTEKQRAARGNEDPFFGVATPVHFRGGSCALDH
jgi:hypothetical protein